MKNLIFIITAILIAIPAYAQFADIPHDKTTLNIGMAFNNYDRSISGTFVQPVKKINGWGGISYIDMGETRTINAHIQGGLRYKGVGIEAFTDFERITHILSSGTEPETTTQVGGFLRPGIYKKGNIRLSGGFGNFLKT